MDEMGDGEVTQYFTVSEVAVALRVSNMTVYRLVNAGELPAVKVGRSVRLCRDEVDRYLSGRLIKAG
jgi:excisionase family DNA binding protein